MLVHQSETTQRAGQNQIKRVTRQCYTAGGGAVRKTDQIGFEIESQSLF